MHLLFCRFSLNIDDTLGESRQRFVGRLHYDAETSLCRDL